MLLLYGKIPRPCKYIVQLWNSSAFNKKTKSIIALGKKRCIIDHYKQIICIIKENCYAFFNEQTYWKNGIWWWKNICLTVLQVYIHTEIVTLCDDVDGSIWSPSKCHTKHLKTHFFMIVERNFTPLSTLQCRVFFLHNKLNYSQERIYTVANCFSTFFSQHSEFKPWLEWTTSPVLWMVI